MTTKTSPSQPSPVRVDVRPLLLRALSVPLMLMMIVAGVLALQVERLSRAAAEVARRRAR